jgi:hypothetical protein
MPRTLTLLLYLGTGEKGVAESRLHNPKGRHFVLLNYQDYLGLLYLDVKNQSLDRRPQDLQFRGAIWPLL